MTAKEYTDWWGEAEVVSLNRTQYMGIVADLAAAEEQEEWWKNIAATADKHRMEMMDEVCRDRSGEQLRLATIAEANAEAEANDLRDALAERERERDELKESLHESNMQCGRLDDMVAGLTRTVDDTVQELAEAERQIDALAAERWETEASIPARERAAYCEGWFGALKSCTDYHHADVMPQKHAARRYPDLKEAT